MVGNFQPHNSDTQEYTVSTLNGAARRLLEGHFQLIWVVGEISNFTRASSGHWYFSLKDDNAQVRCAMFKNRNQFLKFAPKHGDKVRLRAKVSLYEGRGEFQLIGEYLEPAGTGDLQIAFLQLKSQLEAEGLFASERKKSVPSQVKRIGVVTSAKGAALHDILSVLHSRWAGLEIIIADSPVQGAEAPVGLVRALNKLARYHQRSSIDLVIIGRGGGSLEDLWAFNDERVARTIASFEIPIISAVGHETDFTIADWVADARAPTPSAAAAMASPDHSEAPTRIREALNRLTKAYSANLRIHDTALANAKARLRHPGELIEQRVLRIDELELRLKTQNARFMQQKQAQYNQMLKRLHWHSPARNLQALNELVVKLQTRLAAGQQRLFGTLLNRHKQTEYVLHSLSPMRTVDRGYAILKNTEGQVVTSVSGFATNNKGSATLKDGKVDFEVTAVKTLST
jgi:exodeoxyribonuclease VII large subunit